MQIAVVDAMKGIINATRKTRKIVTILTTTLVKFICTINDIDTTSFSVTINQLVKTNLYNEEEEEEECALGPGPWRGSSSPFLGL